MIWDHKADRIISPSLHLADNGHQTFSLSDPTSVSVFSLFSPILALEKGNVNPSLLQGLAVSVALDSLPTDVKQRPFLIPSLSTSHNKHILAGPRKEDDQRSKGFLCAGLAKSEPDC